MPTLPKGYSLYGPEEAAIPGTYSGAGISRAWDKEGVEYMGCCCRGPDGRFGFRIFTLLPTNAWEEVPYETDDIPFCEQRGGVGYNLFSGQLVWTAWNGPEWFGDAIKGATPFPPPLTLLDVALFLIRRLADRASPLAQAVLRLVQG